MPSEHEKLFREMAGNQVDQALAKFGREYVQTVSFVINFANFYRIILMSDPAFAELFKFVSNSAIDHMIDGHELDKKKVSECMKFLGNGLDSALETADVMDNLMKGRKG